MGFPTELFPTLSSRRRAKIWKAPLIGSRASLRQEPSVCSSSKTMIESSEVSLSYWAMTILRLPPPQRGGEAFEALLDRPFDCCVLDLRLPDMTGFELLDKLQEETSLRDVPIVVFTGKELSAQEQERLRTAAKSVVLKDVRSPERLLDETALFLHRAITDLSESKQEMLRQLHESNEALRGRKVLIVDDDARNIFALSIVLENQDMEVLSATNGQQAIKLIRETPDLSIVLMDIMMPEMDGYQTMREIRRVPAVSRLADRRAHRQGYERRPGEMLRSRRD